MKQFLYFLVLLFGIFLENQGAHSLRVRRDNNDGKESNKTNPPPLSLSTPLQLSEKRILMDGITSNPYPRVIEAFKLPIIGFMDSKVYHIMDEVQNGLRYIFQTKNKFTLPVTGTGTLGIETVLLNLVEPGEIILITNNGFWGDRVGNLAKRAGFEVKTVDKTPGTAYSLSELEEAIKTHKPQVLYVTHGESSTGVIQDLTGIGDLCKSNGCLLVVDVVSSIGIVPLFVDRWNIDVAICSSHKALGSVAGFTPLTFSPRAVDKITKRKTILRSFMLDMKELTEFWRGGLNDDDEDEDERKCHHTLPVLQLYALREALSIIAAETLEKSWERHETTSKRLSDGLEKIDLQHFVKKSKHRLTGTIVIKVPEGISNITKVLKYVKEKYNLIFGKGFGPTKDKVIIVGIYGFNGNSEKVDLTLKALKEGIDFVKTGKVDSGTGTSSTGNGLDTASKAVDVFITG